MMYGHVDHPRHWVGPPAHPGALQDRTGGFTEFVPLPFIHTNAPVYLAGARPAGADAARQPGGARGGAAACCTAGSTTSRRSWVKLGVDGTRAMLQRRRQRPRRHADGGDDQPDGRSAHGSAKTVAELTEIADGIGRPVRQRTTTYGEALHV